MTKSCDVMLVRSCGATRTRLDRWFKKSLRLFLKVTEIFLFMERPGACVASSRLHKNLPTDLSTARAQLDLGEGAMGWAIFINNQINVYKWSKGNPLIMGFPPPLLPSSFFPNFFSLFRIYEKGKVTLPSHI